MFASTLICQPLETTYTDRVPYFFALGSTITRTPTFNYLDELLRRLVPLLLAVASLQVLLQVELNHILKPFKVIYINNTYKKKASNRKSLVPIT